MYRMGTPDRNDTPLIIGNLPKRLQEKIITRGSQNNGNDQESESELVLTVQSNNLEATKHSLPHQHQKCDDNLKLVTLKELDEIPLIASRSELTNVDDQQQQKQEQFKVVTEQHNDTEVTAIDHFLRLPSIPANSATVKKLHEENYNFYDEENSANGLSSLRNSKSDSNTAKDLEDNSLVLNSMVVPGILRLNLNDLRLSNRKENRRSNNNNKKNGFRSPSKQYQQQLVQHHNNRQTNYYHNINDLPHKKIQLSSSNQILTNNGSNTPIWFNSLPNSYYKQLSTLYESLVKMIAQHHVLKDWSKFSNLRVEILNIFKQLLLTQIRFCCEHKVDSFIWKTIFYNVREYLKELPSNQSNEIHKCLHSLIDEGISFYINLYQQFANEYLKTTRHLCNVAVQHNTINVSNDGQILRQRSQHKIEMIGKIMAQKLLICLGDLYRYKIKEFQDPKDYIEVTKYYQQAQMLLPSNGVPYNQLAIVAIYSRKKFDAVYFYIRCLMSSNPVNSSKESLLILFDEIRKKYEETELKSFLSPQRNDNRRNNHLVTLKSSKSMRKVVWICPNGVRCLHKTDYNINGSNIEIEKDRLLSLPLEELLRHMLSLYLYIIGKLFTGIGMESIVEYQHKFLLQFDVILQHFEKLPLSRHRFLKMLVLNIAVMDINLAKENRRYMVFNFCNQMFGLIVRRTNELLAALNNKLICYQTDQNLDQRFIDLNTLLQYIRLYLLWLKLHIDIWEPIKENDGQYPLLSYFWPEQLLELFRAIKEHNRTKVNSKMSFDKDIYTFEEDIFLSGFTPLTQILTKSSHSKAMPHEVAQYHERLLCIELVESSFVKNVKQLTGEQFYEMFSTEIIKTTNKDDESINTMLREEKEDVDENLHSKEEKSNSKEICLRLEQSDGNLVENVVENDVDQTEQRNDNKNNILQNKVDSDNLDDQVSQLTRLKRQLEAKNQAKRIYNNRLIEIMKDVDTKLYIEVRPKYLLPDTNCFIDCLDNFQRIVKDFKQYILIVPLTVVKELDGLSKGVKLEHMDNNWVKDRIHHYDDVSTMAMKSLDFIKSSKQNIKCATTKGSIINFSLFGLVEEENVSNDDKILATAIALSKTMSTETNKDGRLLIQTELVLITTDRNLRVKALSRNLAISGLNEFVHWAQGCNS